MSQANPCRIIVIAFLEKSAGNLVWAIEASGPDGGAADVSLDDLCASSGHRIMNTIARRETLSWRTA
jgi:hypothetical protein